jgi:hypothetical protein
MHGFVEDGLRNEPDAAARDLVRVHGYLGVQTLSPDLMSLVRSEAMHQDGDMRGVVERSYEDMTSGTRDDLAALRRERDMRLPVSDELMAFGLLGSVENIVMRASWDSRYSKKDVLWTTLSLFLAVQSLYSGRLDLGEEIARYADTIDQLAETPPPIPPDALQ